MLSSKEPTLTGSESGAPPTHTASVSIALGRLRFGVLLCCWLVVLAIVAQMTVWALASFTDLRWTQITAHEEPPLIVKAEEAHQQQIRSALEVSADGPPHREPVNLNRVLTKHDRIFAAVASLSGGFGTLAVLALLPLVALGVILAASSATSGVDKTVSAFGWSLVVALLAMPIGGFINLPWLDGGFWSYANLTERIDGGIAAGRAVFFAQYLLLPAVCLVGIAVAGMRFSAGVELGLIRKEMLRLDPALEREAANVKPGSLHAGRTAAAMKQAVGASQPARDASTAKLPATPSIKQPSPGEAPRRLI